MTLADINPDADKYVLLGMFVLAIPAILASVLAALKIAKHFKSDPPPAAVATKAHVAAEMKQLELRIEKRVATELGHLNLSISSLGNSYRSLDETFNAQMRDMNRTLGEISGELKARKKSS